MAKRFMVTGGAGFIGSAVVRQLIAAGHEVLVIDKLTYAGNMESLAEIAAHPHYRFRKADICDEAAMRQALSDFEPEIVMHLAAESHVDRSIDGPRAFIETNVIGTFTLLQATLDYWRRRDADARSRFRFHHISTDEVFGALGADGAFTEETPYRPNSPYSASKAGSDHLVRAWHHTYGLPAIVSNCSNNYGPFQFPEKLIPLMIINSLEGRPLPIYGTGANVRDWLYVDDHARALLLVAEEGRVGETYNIGGDGERSNLALVEALCGLLDEIIPDPAIGPRRNLITFVTDRPGHDHRYAIDCAKISRELRWRPAESVESGLARTVRWYVDNRPWWERVRAGTYRGERLGKLA